MINQQLAEVSNLAIVVSIVALTGRRVPWLRSPIWKLATLGAGLVLLLTEWSEYRELDPVAVKGLVEHPRLLDGRNVLDPAAWRGAGWTYRALGRP